MMAVLKARHLFDSADVPCREISFRMLKHVFAHKFRQRNKLIFFYEKCLL